MPRLFFALTATALLTLRLAAAPPELPAPAGDTPDWLATLRSRQTLDADASLRDLNVGVKVKDGVAVVTGAVGSAAERQREVNRLKLVIGVRHVKDDLFPTATVKAVEVPAAKPTVETRQAYKTPVDDPPMVPATVEERVEQVRKASIRAANATVAVQNGMIYVTGNPLDRAVTGLADDLRHLGVGSVILRAP